MTDPELRKRPVPCGGSWSDAVLQVTAGFLAYDHPSNSNHVDVPGAQIPLYAAFLSANVSTLAYQHLGLRCGSRRHIIIGFTLHGEWRETRSDPAAGSSWRLTACCLAPVEAVCGSYDHVVTGTLGSMCECGLNQDIPGLPAPPY